MKKLPVLNQPPPPDFDIASIPEPERSLWQALKSVLDPEYPVSVVDMGLIYGIERDGGDVRVKLTFTAMGCPCMEMIIDDVRACLQNQPGVERVHIEIVWDPPWTRARLSKSAIEQFRQWGITV